MTVSGDGAGAGMDQFPVGMRVLAVDDDPTCLKLLENLLRRCQYNVTTTGQAATALKLLRENKDNFDLVISDVHMPDMDGFKLLELVGLEMDLPVIMLSANGETQTVMKGITHGACDYLLKPVRLEQLRTIWQHVVRRNTKNRCSDNDDAGQKAQNGEGENGGTNRNKRQSRRDRDENEDDGDDSDDNSNENGDSSSQKKPRVVWSVELHRKFVAAVNQLGIDKAVPKKILDLMNVENITRENVASHLQKYRLYLKRMSMDASRQANLVAALGGRNPAYSNMNSLDVFRQYNNAYGRYRPVPTNSHSQSNNFVARMNSPAAYGMHGLLSSQPLQLGHAQNTLGTSLNDLGVNNGNLIRGAHMSTMVTGASGNSFANMSNGVSLAPANRSVQPLESSNRQHLGRINSSSTDSFSSFAGESPHFPDLGRSSNTWHTAVPSNIQELGQNGSMSQATLHVNGPRMESVSSFTSPSNQITSLGNEMQSQVASLASNALPMVFKQDAAPFSFTSSTNSREMLNNNLAFSNSGINTSLPNLHIDSSVVPRQGLDGGNAGGVASLQGGRIDQQTAGNQLNYTNDLMGSSRLQRGLSGGLDDIVVDMFRPDNDNGGLFIDGDWQLV
uniref:Uncharacterized protein n=1 Tax=Avena sativa TaxID=4498 RepID=A0ACD5V521_AVESA